MPLRQDARIIGAKTEDILIAGRAFPSGTFRQAGLGSPKNEIMLPVPAAKGRVGEISDNHAHLPVERIDAFSFLSGVNSRVSWTQVPPSSSGRPDAWASYRSPPEMSASS